jgi:hypothetical protein
MTGIFTPAYSVSKTTGSDGQWNRPAGTPKPLEPGEVVAYEQLAAESRNVAGRRRVTVTGPLKLTDAKYRLEVRLFRV